MIAVNKYQSPRNFPSLLRSRTHTRWCRSSRLAFNTSSLTYARALVQVVTTFIQDFFDQNPISQIALVELRDGKAEKITELSGNARHHKSKLEECIAKGNGGGKGAASLRCDLLCDCIPCTGRDHSSRYDQCVARRSCGVRGGSILR